MNLSAALNYLKIVKNVTIDHIYYGVFEKLGPMNIVRNMPVEERIVPILDITYLSHIQDWALAIENFIKFGNIERLKKLSRNVIDPILKESQGCDDFASSVRIIVNELEKILEGLYTCRFKELKKVKFSELKQKLSNLSSNNDIIPQLTGPFRKLEQKLADIDINKDVIFNIIKLVKWCIDFNWIQQGYTILQENTLSFIIKYLIGEDNYIDKDIRNAASSSINILNKQIPENEWKGDLNRISHYVAKLKEKHEEASGLIYAYCQISELRNDINHGGYSENSSKPETLKKQLEEIYNKIEKLIN